MGLLGHLLAPGVALGLLGHFFTSGVITLLPELLCPLCLFMAGYTFKGAVRITFTKKDKELLLDGIQITHLASR